MIWAKLFVSIFVMSETGSVATTAFTTDLEMSHCQRIMPEVNRTQELQLYDKRATIKVRGWCEPLRADGRPVAAGPEQALNAINGFLQGLR